MSEQKAGQRIHIIGNRIDCFKTYEDLYAFIIEGTRNKPGSGYVTVNNVHTMIEGYWHKDFQAIINKAYLSIPDGKPLTVVGRLKGNKIISRLFGPTVMEKFIDWGRKDNISHFFLGSSEENLQKLKASINSRYPGAKIAGMISPPYMPINKWDNSAFIETINAAKPDFIWIGLGAPKQEHWMYAQYKHINQGVLFGIGAGFDYLAGNTAHAPEWMKKYSLEWLYRLKQEPKRLWKRYLITIPQFIVLAIVDVIKNLINKGVQYIKY